MAAQPSPARLFAALVAADGTGTRCRVTDGSELAVLETALPPRVLADPTGRVLRTELLGRYVVVDEREPGSVAEYPARRAALVRPGERLAPATPRVVYVWDDLSPSDEVVEAMARRAARVGYLGCADSPVRVRVLRSLREPDRSMPAWEPERGGPFSLPVPYPGATSDLDDAFAIWSAGVQVRRSWGRAEHAWYHPPGVSAEVPDEPSVIWLRLRPGVPGRKALAVTETLRAAVLDLYERHVAGEPEAVPPVLHGHGFTGAGFQHAHYLALPDVGHRHARGMLLGAAVWLPAGTAAELVEGTRSALWHLRTLTRPGWFETEARLWAGDPAPRAACPDRWRGPARRWVSALPVVHERWQDGGPDIGEVRRWCDHAGVPSDVPVLGVRTSEVPLLEGAVALRPGEVTRAGKPRRPFGHAEVVFGSPVTGPLVLGRMRQFGLGLMAPVGDRAGR